MDSATAIKVLNIVALSAIMLAIGLRVSLRELAASLRHIGLVLLALSANFVLVPLAAVGLLHLFQAPTMVAVGFLILAVCPGAPGGPSFTSIAKGSVPIATGAMVILAGSSAVLAPALLTTLLRWLAPESNLQFDFLAIAKLLLVTQLLPLGLGIAIYERAPRLAQRIVKPLTLLANLLLLALVGLILAKQYPTLGAVQLRGWLGMGLLFAASLVIGWCCGGADRGARRALAMTTGVRNAAVGLAIAEANFAGTQAVTAVVAFALVSIFGTLAVAILLGKWPSHER